MRKEAYFLLLLSLAGCDILNAIGDHGLRPDPNLRAESMVIIDNSGQVTGYNTAGQRIISGASTPVIDSYFNSFKEGEIFGGGIMITTTEIRNNNIRSYYYNIIFADGSSYLILGWNEADMPMANGLLYGIGYIKDNNGIITSLDPGVRYHKIHYIITVNSPIDVQVSIDTATSVTMSQHNAQQ